MQTHFMIFDSDYLNAVDAAISISFSDCLFVLNESWIIDYLGNCLLNGYRIISSSRKLLKILLISVFLKIYERNIMLFQVFRFK